MPAKERMCSSSLLTVRILQSLFLQNCLKIQMTFILNVDSAIVLTVLQRRVTDRCNIENIVCLIGTTLIYFFLLGTNNNSS